MNSLLIKNAHIISPKDNISMIGDLLVQDGKIVKIATQILAENVEVFDALGLIAIPGLVDIHVHLRDPGFTYKEDIITGCAAAAAGGFTAVCCMPNTKPAVDTPETVKYILDKAKTAKAKVYPVAAISMCLKGENITDFVALKNAGAVGVSDDGRPVEDGKMMLTALKKGAEVGIKVVSHCEDLSIIDGGIINEGEVSRKLGVKGMDRASEDSVTAREIALAAASDTAIHICHVSTKGSVVLIRDAKARGVQVTCETAPHYLFFTDEKLLAKDANFRMNPPLRTTEDMEALIEGLLDGTIDVIATDHAPHSKEEKADFMKSPNGVVGLETSFGACYTKLVLERGMSVERLITLMSVLPSQIMNIPNGSLKIGESADITLIDLNKSWTVNSNEFYSKGVNTAFAGVTLTGKPIATILDGKIVYNVRKDIING